MSEGPSAELSLAFDVILLGNRRDTCGVAKQLAWPLQDDLGPAVVILDMAPDLNVAPGELAHIAHLLQVSCKHDDRERTCVIVLAEIKKMHSSIPLLYAKNSSSYTLRGADVLARVSEGDAIDAVGSVEGAHGHKEHEEDLNCRTEVEHVPHSNQL